MINKNFVIINPFIISMVFYGKKRSETEQNYEQYHSIREQILKQLGQRITPVYQKSLATIFSDAGETILVATQSILDFPKYFKTTQLYRAYEEDRKTFKTQMEPDVLWYQSLANRITQNKLFIINKFTVQQRIFALNASVCLLGLMTIGGRKGFMPKMRGLLKTCLIGYSVGGIFLVPEIYNSMLSNKLV